jgi:hypothetical protein
MKSPLKVFWIDYCENVLARQGIDDARERRIARMSFYSGAVSALSVVGQFEGGEQIERAIEAMLAELEIYTGMESAKEVER